MKVVVRAKSHFMLIRVIEHAGYFAAEGLEPIFERIDDSSTAARELRSGGADVIFGSHHTPYLEFDSGEPWVYLGQTSSTYKQYLVTRKSVSSLEELRGKTMALPPLMNAAGRLVGHGRGNWQLLLERAGVSGEVEFAEDGGRKVSAREKLKAVADGVADGAFVGKVDSEAAKLEGLRVLELPPLPMVHMVTVTTLWNKVEKLEERARFEALLRALSKGVKYFKTEPEKSLNSLEGVADSLGIATDRELKMTYQEQAEIYDSSLVPTIEAIRNAFRLAEMDRPGIEQRVNPLALWDLHMVRKVNEAKRRQ